MPAHSLPKEAMSAKHTPGPWRVGGTGFVVGGEGDALNADFVALRIIRAPGTPLRHQPTAVEDEANARLMAAAPELLAVLKTTAENIRSLGPAGALYHPYQEWLRVVDEAIVKAEGVR